MGEERLRSKSHKKLKDFLVLVNNHGSTPLTYTSAREMMARVEEVWRKFEVAQEALEATAVDAAALTVQEAAGDEVEKTFSDVRGKLRSLIEIFSTRIASSGSGGSGGGTSNTIKLPTMSLPNFEGNYADWISFKDLFTAAVANNTDLSASQKLQYLKSSLRGDPLHLIEHLTTTDPNYKEAWKILDLRYDCKKEIIRSHVSRLLDLKPVKSENAKELQVLIDSCVKCLNSLKVMNRPTDQWDDLVVVLIEKKLDPVTRREWAKLQTGSIPSTFKELETFINSHIRGLQAAGASSLSHSGERRVDKQVKIHHTATEVGQCLICNKGTHPIYECKEFVSKAPSERSAMVRRARLCYNCLKGNHQIKSCTSNSKCRKCGSKHHTFLHEERPRQPQGVDGNPEVAGHHVGFDSRGLLMTALVHVVDKHGVRQPCRVFIDAGAQGDFITEACTNRLGLAREAHRVQVTGLAECQVGTSKGLVHTTLFSHLGNKKLSVDLHIIKKITGNLPTVKCKSGTTWKHLEGLKLADPTWHQPGPTDILLGVRYFNKVLLSQRRVGKSDQDPVAWDTIFGWVVAGTCPDEEKASIPTFHIRVDPTDSQLRKFWEVEEPPHKRILTKEEKFCEKHFTNTFKRDSNGRFVVGVPFDEDKKKRLGRSRDIALKRLYQVEKRLNRNPSLNDQYTAFMKEYEDLGHMSLVSPTKQGEKVGETNYLCHHFVQNNSSTTTKLRVVFDGSAATSSGISINDTQIVGATLQDDLYDLLLRFRVHAIVIKADIAKMFRQFQLREEDINFHRILWRENTKQQVREYQLNTVTYGTACAPNLATRCVQQLGFDCASSYPLASKALLNDTYIDDVLSGASSEAEGIEMFHQLNQAVSKACLDLRKWTSNSAAVMSVIPEDMRETKELVFDDEELVKALGVQWCPSSDHFTFKSVEVNVDKVLTKRLLLSELAKVFDPLGLISCVTLRGKLILQELWKLPMGWDDEVPATTKEKWEEYKNDLQNLSQLNIPRRVTVSGAESVELHGFCDSSELSFGAIIYLRSLFPNGSVEVKFITSKTRVAPVRQVTLPRLELCGAVLVSELIVHVKECLQLEVDMCLWSDSTIVLTWIAASPRRWKTFVANRVATIQELTTADCWKHVAGVENPADISSRGCSLEDLCCSSLWWQGPDWLSRPSLPIFPKSDVDNNNLEERVTEVAIHHVNIEEDKLLVRFSSLVKFKRATAWWLRFYQFLKTRKCDRGPLSASEVQTALLCWIRNVQQQYFKEEHESLKKLGHVGCKSKMKSLYPFVDNVGIIRVSGRLAKSNLPENRKHQIILPGESHLAKMIISYYHEQNFHSGFQLTWSSIQTEYYILRGRDRVRHFVRSCVRCRRYRAKVAEQLMGDLPSPRVTPSRPFLHTGVDYAGPFTFKNAMGRAPKTYKGYLCLFVCLATKGIHLEAVSSLSTEAFIAALRRFVSRRGFCAHLYSDCGTNFVGAEKEIRSFMMSPPVMDAACKEMCNKGIAFHFNPPAAPHQGGLWEAGVKSAKYHLRRVIGNTPLTFEQFTTVICQVEAVLNSRPLYAMSSDPTDLQPLTPGHFLVGEPLTAVPDSRWIDIPHNRLSMYQKLQQQLQHFWQRWNKEYLNTLQQRNKWMWDKGNVKPGDLVLLAEETAPGTWKMGRVVETHPGVDGKVRTVTVKTATSKFQRVVAKLIPLINNDDNHN